MPRKPKTDKQDGTATPLAEDSFKVKDRRHWVVEDDGDQAEAAPEPARPTILDEYRLRAEEAERKLQEYIEAFKTFKQEQESFRERMQRDVNRRVELQFGELVRTLLESLDNLDLAMSHARDLPAAAPLIKGLTLARDRFLASLEQQGVERVTPEASPFDPNEAEAVRVDPVDARERDGEVTETLRPGYRLGSLVIRPARVAVGRYASGSAEGAGD